MKRAVIYARVSTDRQADEGVSIDSQIESCKRKAEQFGAVVVKVLADEGISGATDARPGFRAAINRCALNDVDLFICWSSSRFARDQHDAISYKRELTSYGTKLVYAQSEIDLESYEGWMLDSFQQVMDESYSRQVSRDTSRSLLALAREGYFTGGHVPFGYESVPAEDNRRRRLAVREPEAAVVRRMFDWARAGLGAKAIAQRFNDEGLRMRGKRWHKGSVLYMLNSEVYMGVVIFNRMHRKTRTIRPEEGWIRVAAHPGIVSEEEWRAVQQGMRARVPQASVSPANSGHVFTGLLRCGACNSSLLISTGTGRGKKVYSYYTCRAHLQGERCTFKAVRAEEFDNWMLEQLLDKLLTRDVIQGVLDRLDDASARWHKDRAARRSALVLELRAVEGRRSKLFDVIEDGGRDTLGLADIQPRLRKLNEQAKQLELSLTRLENEPEPPVDRLDVSPEEAEAVFRETVRGCQEPKTLQAFVATIAQTIVVNPADVVVHYKPECLVMADGTPVRSEHSWLPVPSLLGTAELVIQRPPLRGTDRRMTLRAA